MEMIRYWRIVRRRWWLPTSLLLIVAVVSLVTRSRPPQRFATSFRFNVGMEPVPPPGAEYTYNPLDVWQSSEYLMDDLASAVRGGEFARRVAERVGESVNPAGAFSTATEHRALTVYVSWGDREQLARIANAAVAVLQEEADELVGPLGNARPVLRLIDPPVVVPVGPTLRQKLDLPIRLGLALCVGVAFAFLLDYLDRSVRDREEVESMGISVLGCIPRHK